MMNLLLVGLNHRTAGIELREKFAFEEARLPRALRQIKGFPSIDEILIISTCNRIELLSKVTSKPEGLDSLENFFCANGEMERRELAPMLYRFSDDEVVRHVLRVTSSLDSMILGEPQILGQVKSSYAVAVQSGTVETWLNGLLQGAFHTAKRVRTETSIGEYTVSVSSAAVELARKIFGTLAGKTVLVIGTGKMGELAIQHLSRAGVQQIRVTNRSPEIARELAQQFGATAIPFGHLLRSIAGSDIVITSTGAREKLVTYSLAQNIVAERKNRPIIFIDISVPRNVDPEVSSIESVFYYDIDDLGAVVEANLKEREHEASAAERIVEQEVEALSRRLRSLSRTPVVTQLQSRIEEICRGELQRYLRRAGVSDEAEKQELELMVSRIAGKIAHPLITHVRNTRDETSLQDTSVDIIRRIFKLQKSSEPNR